MHEVKDGNLKISQLRALVAVAEHGNFSCSALALGLSQSTVSHAIATLEDELGVVLLFRGRHGATLTPIGEQVIQEARQILHLLGTIREKANLAKRLRGYDEIRAKCDTLLRNIKNLLIHQQPSSARLMQTQGVWAS
jgi:DNA-binding transcriptional LysR family regulator